MRIVWDEPKRLRNLAKHGMDFVDLAPDFFEDAILIDANNGRLMAINRLFNGIVAVVFARLGSEAISVISMRPASRQERNL